MDQGMGYVMDGQKMVRSPGMSEGDALSEL